jgi:hypothetical protein
MERGFATNATSCGNGDEMLNQTTRNRYRSTGRQSKYLDPDDRKGGRMAVSGEARWNGRIQEE